MKKRCFALLLALTLACSCCMALAEDTPNPIPVLDESEIRATPAGLHHYMLICMDSYAAELNNPGHTDGLILLTVDDNASNPRVMLTSFIRDMLIQRPDGKFGRINNIMGYFSTNEKGKTDGRLGLQALVDTINSHFDLRIEDYIVVDFQQVDNIIEALGGVDITITKKEASYLKSYAIDKDSTTPAISGAGTYHFSGHAAVIYMRIRKVANIEGETQDVGRTRRARTVLTSIADSLKDITYDQALKLLDVIINNTVYTTMTTDDMMEALDLAMRVKGTPVESIRMPIDGTYELMPVAGMSTQQIDYIANRAALWDFLVDPFAIVMEDDDDWLPAGFILDD